MEKSVETVRSADGTEIAFARLGTGAGLILVDGAVCHRAFGRMPSLAPLLAPHFTVFMYDRRGRNQSGDTRPYAVEREVEDIAALIDEAGGSAYLYGVSSGAALALEAAASQLNITKLALFEPPFMTDPQALLRWQSYKTDLNKLLAEGRHSDAIELFMAFVGTPAEAIDGMRQAPFWPMLEAVAPTLAYDAAVLGDQSVPAARAASIKIPTLVMDGGASPDFMRQGVQALQQVIPGAQRRTLEGQSHDAAAEAVAPALIEFFTA